jgi:hypothetical protein
MRILGTITAAVLLIAGTALADEATVQSGEVTKRSTHSTTIQSNPGGQPEVRQHSDIKVKTREQATSTDANTMGAVQSDTKVEKKNSTSVTSEETDSDVGKQTHMKSDTRHEHTSKTVTQ